ncbi:MAG: SDR family oxidoreductase [Dehalococcoidales bacterium]|nr:MAG: SDR family oxidoreductase [Dehalococcoidales bacterium]
MTERKPRLEGKVAIVTGAGSRGEGIGNGKAAAVLFAREGAKVLLVDLYPARVNETLETIITEGGEASIITGDVTSPEDCLMIIKTSVERYGKLDILHNNVGIDSAGSINDVEIEEWDRVMNINLKSMMLMCRAAIPQMITSGGGSITNVSSIAALRPNNMDAYSTSKGGVIALTRTLASSHAKNHIRVNCILPGMVYTPMVAEGMDEEMRKRRRESTPLQIEGTAWDTGWAAVFLNSNEARWITGTVLPVDGGALLTRRNF